MSDPMLTDQYRPQTWSDIQGNNSALKQIKTWARSWSPGDPPLFLHGPPGVGKTSTVFVIANDQGWTLNDVNASDARTSDDMDRIVADAKTVPPNTRQLVFIDEVDNLHGRTNIDGLASLLSNPPNPIVLAANEPYDVPHSIKSPCREFEFKLGKRSRKAKLKEIVEAEGFDLSTQEIDALAERPDLRSAINDLQTSIGGEVVSDPRQYDENPFEAVRMLLTGKQGVDVDETPDSFLWWLDENWRSDASGLGHNAKDLRGIEIPLAFDALSRSDEFLEHAFSGDYRFWKYASELQQRTAGLRLTEPYNSRISVDFPQWYRLSEPKATDETPEAALFRALSGYDDGSPKLSGNYRYFRLVVLPRLLEQSEEDLIQLCVDYDLNDQAVKGLNLTSEQVAGYKGEGDWEERNRSHNPLTSW